MIQAIAVCAENTSIWAKKYFTSKCILAKFLAIPVIQAAVLLFYWIN